MAAEFAKEIGLLRTLTTCITTKALPAGPITEELLRTEGLARVMRQSDSLVAILQSGGEAFAALAKSVITKIPAIERGTIFSSLETELFSFLVSDYVGRDPSSIGARNVVALYSHFTDWFQRIATPRRFFVPCVISPWPAPRFSIGPVDFVYIDEVPHSDLYPREDAANILIRHSFDSMLELMKGTHANWLTRVSIEGCEPRRAEEVGALAVDLALVALQVVAPKLDTRNLCRLDARRGAPAKRTLSESEGSTLEGWIRREPGLSVSGNQTAY